MIRHDPEEESQEDHHADANEAGDDAALDLVEPFLFGCDAAPPFTFLFSEEHVRHPGLTPIELFPRGARHHPFARALQIRAALSAEFEIFAGLKPASWTEHNHSSENNHVGAEFIRHVTNKFGAYVTRFHCFRASQRDMNAPASFFVNRIHGAGARLQAPANAPSCLLSRRRRPMSMRQRRGDRLF
jgi:hypothetical protein